jgi:hypothetical protein
MKRLTVYAVAVLLAATSARAQTPLDGSRSAAHATALRFSPVHTLARTPDKSFAMMAYGRAALRTFAFGPAAASAPVTGSGTAGSLPKWIGHATSSSMLGDSALFEDKFGRVGIGTNAPSSRLTVAGRVESLGGGFKFPDGTVQTTAAFGSIFHDASLAGDGTSGSPLGIAVPLFLTGSVPPFDGVVNVTNVLEQGTAMVARGGDGTVSAGVGLRAFGGNSPDGLAGRGLIAQGGFSATGNGGIGLEANGGNTASDDGGDAGAGLRAFGGGCIDIDCGSGGDALVGFGGNTNSLSGGKGGAGVFAAAGLGPLGDDGLAGDFFGDVEVSGTLTKGGGSFKIDHPLDPENRFLYHSFVESPDMKNIYDGVVTLDGNGEAVVEMPEWFGALNRDLRYLLTAVGAPMPGLHVAEKVKDNRFKISGGQPGMEVSWQVTGIRQDAWANKNRIRVEVDKTGRERGLYLHPEAFDQPEERGLANLDHPDLVKQRREARERMARTRRP